MPSKSFKSQVLNEYRQFGDKASRAIERVAIGAWQRAVDATPKPPSAPGASYQRTGRLAGSWKLNTGRNVGLIPAVGQYPKPQKPNFKFDINRHKLVQLWNNVPYASFVNDGLPPGRTPLKMLEKGKAHFELNIVSELNKITIK